MSVDTEANVGDASSEHRPARRGLRTAIPWVVVIVLLCELAVRAAAPKLRDPLLWPDWEAQNKVSAMDHLAATRGGASVVFVGSSMVNAGMDSTLATELLGAKRPAFNAALNGSDLRATEIWTRNVVVPRLKPKVVVVGFSSGEANDNRRTRRELYRLFQDSPLGASAAGTDGVLQKVDAWFIQHSYLVRYRRVFRNPVDAVVGSDRAQFTERVGPLGRLEALAKFQQRPYSTGGTNQLENFARAFGNYGVGGVQFQALDRLVKDLTGRGIRVVLLRMPVTKDIVPLHPRGQADRDAFTAVLASFVGSHQVTFIDADAMLPSTSSFVDPVHLNETGRRQVTEMLVRRLLEPA